MSLHREDRAVSEVLGGILLFGIVVALLVILQVAAVPGWNQQVEYEHNQRVQADLGDLGDSFSRIAATGRAEAGAIEAGVRYPVRPFLLNPPAAEGWVYTSDLRTVTIANAEAVNPETDDHFEIWDGVLETRDLAFRPDYNEFRNAPTSILGAGSLFYNEYTEAWILLDEGNLIQGNRITLTLLDGTVDEQTLGAVTVGATPISAPSERVSIQGRDDQPLTLTVATDAPHALWEEVLGPQLDEDGTDPERYVESFACAVEAANEPCEELTVTLEAGQTYSLSMALVGLADTGESEPAYLTRIGAGTVTLPEGSATTFTVGVRDAYNNPKAGLAVEWVDESGSQLASTTTGEDGNTAFEYSVAGVGAQAVTARIDIDGDGSYADHEVVTYQIESTEVENPTADFGANLNPAGPDKVVVTEDIIIGQGQCKAGSTNADCRAYVTFENRDSQTKSIDSIRVNVYVASQPGQASRERPVSLNVTQDEFGNDTVTSGILQVRGDFVAVPMFEPIDPGEETYLTFRFFENTAGTAPYGVANGDFIVITVLFDDDTAAIYFLAPIKGPTPTGT
jgi:hypothetical protein